MGSFEAVIPLLDAINNLQSDRLDGVDQFIQSLLVFYNCKLGTDEDGKEIELSEVYEEDTPPYRELSRASDAEEIEGEDGEIADEDLEGFGDEDFGEDSEDFGEESEEDYGFGESVYDEFDGESDENED